MKRGIKLLLAGLAITAAIIAVTPLIVIQKIRMQIRQAGAIPCDSGGACANLLEACDAGGNRRAFRAGPILAKLAAIRGVDALIMRDVPLSSQDLTCVTIASALQYFANYCYGVTPPKRSSLTAPTP